MSREKSSHKSFLYRYLALALVLAALISAAAGTLAWLQYKRSLQTMTRIQFSTLKLTGIDVDSIPVDLGEINMKDAGRKEMPFRVIANAGTKYILQIGHTTNLPLSYKICVYKSNAEGDPIEGSNLNLSGDGRTATTTYHSQTYIDGENKDKVQPNAEPVYWQSTPILSTGEDTYVLIVSWEDSNEIDKVIDKDTEMIYLTAGLGGYETNETT